MLMRVRRAAAMTVGVLASLGSRGSKAAASAAVVQTSGRVGYVDARLIQIEDRAGRAEFYYLDETSLREAPSSIEGRDGLVGLWVRLLVATDTCVVRSVRVVAEEPLRGKQSRRAGRRDAALAAVIADR